jgi:phosphatidylglycerol:prolipoprotein diacylglycerol transferase
VFPAAGPEPRHPSQLYQFALEGLALFTLVWLFSRQPRPTGAVGGLFLAGYGVFRFIVEFARQPDAHLGLNSLGLSQGQMLSIPMILLGMGLMVYAYQYNNKEGKA